MGTAEIEVEALKRELRMLKTEAKRAAEEASAADPATPPPKTAVPAVSPLAPDGGFPEMPRIAGVRFATVAAGVRYHDRPDVMLAELAPGTTIAGVFTRSATRAAPVLDCEAKIGGPSESGAAFIVNSGNANAFTGEAGREAVSRVTKAVAEVLGLSPARVFPSSTGVIGEPLPHQRITEKLEELAGALGSGGFDSAARAIMTTDTFAKGAAATVELRGGPVRIAGIAKGSGMIAPDMATMLAYMFTDAAVARPLLQSMLSELADETFNAITVDGDTSTSDTLLLAATGQAGSPIAHPGSPDAAAFREGLREVMLYLAHQIVRDGEGATKFVEVRVGGATTDADARKVALAIANSPLVKTAIAGADPNWGRIVMAVGKSGAAADRDRLAIRFGDITVAENGWVAPSYREEDGAAYMTRDELVLEVDLGLGTGASRIWTCDLTHGYIAINADYRS